MPWTHWGDKLIPMAGRVVTVQGVVIRTHHDEKGGTRFFNFDKNRDRFSFVMFESATKLFQAQGESTEDYLQKKIQVTGVLTIHKGRPSMVVNKPEQIVLVRRISCQHWHRAC
jgi:DNA/RNA endonuclease YhcR with UshA esterase domain